MKKLILLLTAISCIAISVSAQNFCWAKQMGGISNDEGTSIAIDASGNVFTTGYFSDSADFDPGPGTFYLSPLSNSEATFVSKLDANGNLVWAKQMGSGPYPSSSIAVDASGNVFIAGSFEGTADFDPGAGTFNLTSVGYQDIFICELDANGNFVWAKQFGGVYDDFGTSIAVDASGNVITTGYFQDAVDFDPNQGTFNLTSVGSEDIFVSKLDVNGNFVWAKQIGGVSGDWSYDIAVDDSGNVFTTGSFYDIVDFDPGAGTFYLTANYACIFISKLDSNGNFVWAKQMGGSFDDYGLSITVDASENVYTTGYFQDTCDFDPSTGTFNLTSVGLEDIFISKLDANGNFVWAKQLGGINNEYNEGTSIAVDDSGNVYTTGYFHGTFDFDPGMGTFNLTSAGFSDMFISKLDSNGDFLWAGQMGGPGYEDGYSIAVDASGNVYTTGGFHGTTDFDPGAGTFYLSGSADIFVSKLCQVASGIEENNFLSAIEIFPNPFSIQTILQTTVELKDATLTVSNCYGQTVREIKNINGQSITLTRGSLESGLYFVWLIQDYKVIAIKKIVITD